MLAHNSCCGAVRAPVAVAVDVAVAGHVTCVRFVGSEYGAEAALLIYTNQGR